MTSSERIQIIKTRVMAAFSPTYLEVLDDSDQHIGHPGSRDGAGHYTILIDADTFSGQSRVTVHRAIYGVLQDLMPHEIHALRIKVGYNCNQSG